ncbi:MAG TPA: sensor histidine kinase, partial [Nitrososphaeraceae archaeon]|nr:sensor histidine kinase [Nitrososphaeraceae archaeon]
MALIKKYDHFSGRKKNELAIIFIISIIVISYGLFFYLQNNTESNIRNSLFEQQKQRQIESTQALSRHISSDLDSIMARLQLLANSPYLQQEDLLSNKTNKLMKQMYFQMNNITKVDRLFILDGNNIQRIGIVPKGENTFVGVNFTYRDWVRQAKSTLMPVFSDGFMARDGKYRIAIAEPIINAQTGNYVGLVGGLIPTTEFFAHYGNIYNIKSNFLVVFDKKGDYIATPRTQLLGKNYFGSEAQQIFHHNPIQGNLYRQLLQGQPGNAVYDFGIGERLNTGYPIFVQGKPTYFVSAVTPTSVIYSQINGVIFTERIEMFSLLAGTTAAIVVLIIFLIKWSSTLNDEVKRRTRELNESNTQLNMLTKELKRANDSLMASNKQLAVANEQLKLHDKMQKEFINIASHEIKTPTQAILGYTEILQNHPEKREQIFDALYRNANRLQRLTNDILDVTRIESQTLRLNKEKFNLTDLISNIVEDFKHDIQKKGSDTVLSYQPEYNLFVEADKERITQVISNLLSNAVKFTKQGRISINVMKKTNRDAKNNNSPEEVVVSVEDTGTSIDSEILPRLFTKFATKSEVAGGTGLGLFISKSIIESHGGKMWA